jgi:hypothetical protein
MMARRLVIVSLVVTLVVASEFTQRQARAAAYISLVGYTLLNSGDLVFEAPEADGSLALGNYAFPDGQVSATTATLIHEAVPTNGILGCPLNNCPSGPNSSDLDSCVGAQCREVPSGQSCQTTANPPVPCYDVPYAFGEGNVLGAQIGGSYTQDGIAFQNSFVLPDAVPDANGHTLHLTVSGLPAGASELVLYLAGTAGSTPSTLSGCFTVASGGTSVEQYGFVNGDAQGRGTGEFIQWEISGFSSVDIYESNSACGNTTVSSTDGRVAISGLFFELPPPPATATPLPTATTAPTSTLNPIPTDTSTPVPTSTSTPVPSATSTPVSTNTSTSVPTTTATAVPTNTLTGVPTDTSTAVPTITTTALTTDTSTVTPRPESFPTATPTPMSPPDTPAIQLQHVKVAAGSKLKGTVLTSPGADITAQLEVKQHKELVYEATKHGIADGKGSYALSMRIRFHPSKRARGLLIITADSAGGTAINSTTVTILPHA